MLGEGSRPMGGTTASFSSSTETSGDGGRWRSDEYLVEEMVLACFVTFLFTR
jgi:hypothetical protein